MKKPPNPYPLLIPDRLGNVLIFHLNGDPETDEPIIKDFCANFGYTRPAVEAHLKRVGFVLQPYRTIH